MAAVLAGGLAADRAAPLMRPGEMLMAALPAMGVALVKVPPITAPPRRILSPLTDRCLGLSAPS